MTFSLLATDGTGAFGMVVSSSSPAVAARCLHLRSGVGGVGSQNVTDPGLGPRLLDTLATGVAPRDALAALVAREPNVEYRQLTVVDANGRTVAYSGDRCLGVHAASEGDGAVAAGNLLADERVPKAMLDAWMSSTGDMEQRLVGALAAALDAGGEAGPVRSAGLAVVREQDWRVTDLRVDWHEHPVAELTRLWELWAPQRDDYVVRALDPGSAPSYGVAGDR